jgi:hypothetical protein
MTEVVDRPATAGADDDGARERQNGLRGTYRSLQDMEARQRAIVAELANIDKIGDPDEGDLAWQGTLITEHDDLEALAEPLRKRAKDMERVRAAHADPGNREEPARTPDLQTTNVAGQDPFRDLQRVRHGLVEPREVRGRAVDAIEYYSKRGDLVDDFADNATHLAQDQYLGQSNVARHILETGSQEYYDTFREYLSDPGRLSGRASLTLTSANGGYLLPFVDPPSLTNAGRELRADPASRSDEQRWNGVSSAGPLPRLARWGDSSDKRPVGNVVALP